MYTSNSKKNDLYIGFDSVNEIWTTLIWNGITVPRYTISNYGRMYDHRDNRFLTYTLDKDGYFLVSIHIENVGYKKPKVHRLILMSFENNPEFNELHVNHKDGNKLNPNLYNLEWMKPIENTRHGWNTGLNKNIGLNNGNGKYDEATIRKICEYIDEGLTNPQIADMFGLTETKDRMRLSATISGIRDFETHGYISKDYNFTKGQVTFKQYDLNTAESVCKLLSNGQNYTYKDIADLLGIPDEEYKIFKVFINNLIGKRTAKSVTSKYSNLKKPIG